MEISGKDKLKRIEESINSRANEIFTKLAKELSAGGQTVSLETIRSMLRIHCVDERKREYNKTALNMISSYKLKEHIIDGSFDKGNYYEETLSQAEFREIINGSKTKDILFNNSKNTIDNKRTNIEDYSKLYSLFTDKDDGISVNNLAKCLEIAAQTLEGSSSSTNYLSLAQDIINTLGRSFGDKLTPEDFINIMTSEADIPDSLAIK